jgi:hypothetical protein
MKRVTAFTMVLLLMLGAASVATDTRVMTMGENNLVLVDDANIWLFPSRIFDYPNLAVGEFSRQTGNDFTQFGIHWKFGSDNPLVVGTYFTDLSDPALPDNLLGDDLVAWDLLSDFDNRRIDLIYGNELGAYVFGWRISIFHGSAQLDYPDPAINQSRESFGYYDFDFGLTSESGNWDVALNFALGNWTDENALGQAETEPDGFFDFSVLGRYFMERNPSYTVIPHVGFIYNKRGIKEYVVDPDDADLLVLDQTSKYNVTAFNFGLGTNYTPSRNVLAVCDFGFSYAKWKDEAELEEVGARPAGSFEDTEAFTILPYFKIGLDADVFKWMDIRLGATSFWNNQSIEDKTLNTQEKYKFADNETYLGFGFHWNRLHIDTYTDPELFLDGFNFISGGDVDMNFGISAIYEMM